MSINRAKHVQVRDENARQRKVLDDESSKISAKTGNVVSAIIGRNDGNYFISRKRAYLLEWRRVALRRRHCYKMLTLCLTRTLLMTGFNGIRDQSRDVLENERHGKGGKTALKIYSKCRMRAAFDQWRKWNYEKAVVIIQEVTFECNQKTFNHEVKTRKARNKQASDRHARVGRNNV